MDYAFAGPSTSSPPPLQHHSPSRPPARRSSLRNFRANAPIAAYDSPPSTPPPRPRPNTKKGKRPLRAYASEDAIAAGRHSHGLSWSSTTRDSVVDNLLFSLDNLSRHNVVDRPDPLDSDEKRLYLASLTASRSMTNMAQRARGHTHSSSASDYDRHPMDSPASKYSGSVKGRYSTNLPNVPSFSVRSSAGVKSMPNRRTSTATRESTDVIRNRLNSFDHQDGENGGDFGYGALLDSSKLGWAAQRSISLDNIYGESPSDPSSVLDRGRPVPSVHSKYEASLDGDADAAPEPIVAAGPRKMQNPTATGPVYVNAAPGKGKGSSLRKITTRTDLRANAPAIVNPPIPQDVRNQAADFVRTASMRGSSIATTVPDRDSVAAAPTPQAGSRKKESSAAQEKPGFFKRVFGGGSSRNASNPPANPPERPDSILQSVDPEPPTAPTRTRSQTSAVSHAKTEPRQSTSANNTSYPPPSLNKKPSSFFRRRKKSLSDSLQAPPMPINVVNPSLLQVKAAEPSPSISSLRKVMDPFLNQEKASADAAPAAPPKVGDDRPATQDTNSDSLDIFHSGYTPPPDASLGARHPWSRERSSVPGTDSPGSKLKVKKRRPDMLAINGTAVRPEATPTKGHGWISTPVINDEFTIEQPKVSPLTDVSLRDDKGPSSRPSTGDGIIASQATSPVAIRTLQEFGTGTNVDTDINEDGWVIKHHPHTERTPSRTSERLILQPTPSEERLNLLNASNNQTSSDETAPLSPSSSNIQRKGSRTDDTLTTWYHSASSLISSNLPGGNEVPSRKSSEAVNTTLASSKVDMSAEYKERAQKIWDGDETYVSKIDAAAWMGERTELSAKTLEAYMQLFDFAGLNVLAALRMLCGKLTLRGETQQFDRIITALSSRWCVSNPNHGFKAQDVVHTITYSLILLNTDLHLADIGEKMSRGAYVKNTLPTIRRVVTDAAPHAFDETLKPGSQRQLRPSLPWTDSASSMPNSPVSLHPLSPNDRTSFEDERPSTTNTRRLSVRPNMSRGESEGPPETAGGAANALVNAPWSGPLRGWEAEIESVLKYFWSSIRAQPLPLHGSIGSENAPPERSNMSLLNVAGLKRSNSIVSKAPSDTASYRSKQDFRSMALRPWQNRANRSRPKVYPASTIGSSSRTSFEDGNSIWSPAQSSKYSFSKTLTSASVGSLGYHFTPADSFKHSIGFANALSQAIIREETANGDNESLTLPGGLLEDESLTLEGAPWAKEGLVKHKHHLETPDRKAKERQWNDCFAVISKGKLTLFAFNTSTKSQSMGRRAHGFNKTGKAQSVTATKVGGGDWMENAETLDTFILRQTIASTLPPPGYSKTRPHVWALSLPSGAVHLFQVGTPEIAAEFMTTANYWSARLSKEPLAGGVSNIEYGWSENVINSALLDRPESLQSPPAASQNRGTSGIHSMSTDRQPARPSLQSSMRSSFDTGFGAGRAARLPGDKAQLMDWQPPSQSMMASQLMEVDQLRQLTTYVTNSEQELEKHNELKHAIELAFSPRHPNFNKAMTNWQRKSDYLLREIVKFRTYMDSLTAAQKSKEAFYAKKVEGRLSPVAKDDGEESQLLNAKMMRNISPRGIHTSG